MSAVHHLADLASNNENLPLLIVVTLLFPFAMLFVGSAVQSMIRAMPRRLLRRE